MNYNFRRNCIENINIEKDKIAILTSSGNLSWSQLYSKSLALVELFKVENIPQGHPVVIYGHKELFFPVAILAAKLSNLPYIPIDSSIPIERLKKIIKLTNSQIIINCSENNFIIDIPLIVNSKLGIERKSPTFYQNTIYGSKEDPIRYIIFTSGSTGEPKGVQITQSSLVSFSDWLEQDFDFSSKDVFINQAVFSFDLSVYELVAYLHFGATLLLVENQIQNNISSFIQFLKKKKGTVLIATPSFVFLCLREAEFNNQKLEYLHTFLFCGEELPNITAKLLLQKFPDSRILNSYGPTEATVATTLVNCTEKIINKYKILPVGYPKSTCQIYIDMKNDDEIVIVGDNVSIGYFKNDSLNKEKFFRFKRERAFRTGDQGYFKDKMLFFTGRKDDQIKLHGYRIELGEINSIISNIEFVKSAFTVPLKRDNKVKRLITFVVINEKLAKSIQNPGDLIINKIKDQIPEYMIPGEIVFIEKIPLSNNHKIDKLKLLEHYAKLKS